MTRRTLLSAMAAAGALSSLSAPSRAATAYGPLKVPSDGTIKGAFIISEGANVMDLAGPWETFQDVALANGDSPFRLMTVADSMEPVSMTSGLRVLPHFTFSTAPTPDVVVIGAQRGHTDAMLDFIRNAHGRGATIMSVCTGAFKLAMTGLLDGKRATTHHEFYEQFAKQFPKVELVRGERFVDDGSIVTAGGLTSGIQGAMHVVSRYYDDAAALRVAKYMEFVPTQRPE